MARRLKAFTNLRDRPFELDLEGRSADELADAIRAGTADPWLPSSAGGRWVRTTAIIALEFEGVPDPTEEELEAQKRREAAASPEA